MTKKAEKKKHSEEKKKKTPVPVKEKEKKRKKETAETMAARQRDISVSEFFAKNRHLLGFDNPRKALLTAIKEAVDNSLDACEEADILPDIVVGAEDLGEDRFKIMIQDNGPGIADDEREELLQRGVRGDERVDGHGLGLAIVLEIIGAYNGEIAIGPSDLGGARITVSLRP